MILNYELISTYKKLKEWFYSVIGYCSDIQRISPNAAKSYGKYKIR